MKNTYKKINQDCISIQFRSQETIGERTKLRRRKADNKDLFDISLLESDEEVNKGKGLKILTPSKLLTRLPILFAQIKA